MQSRQKLVIKAISISLLFLGACSSSDPVSCPEANAPRTETTDTASPSAPVAQKDAASHPAIPQKGGQVVESGPYHLELIALKEAKGAHLDFYLQKGDNHETIPNAKVIAQIQLPDGSQKTLSLPYDAPGEHYAALLPATAIGEYQVKVTADIQGKKVDGRFNFKQ